MFEDKKNKLLSPWSYVGYRFLYSIPVIGLIVLVIHSFSDKNMNRRNFAISIWCTTLVTIIIVFLLLIVLAITGLKEVSNIKDAVEQIIDSLPVNFKL